MMSDSMNASTLETNDDAMERRCVEVATRFMKQKGWEVVAEGDEACGPFDLICKDNDDDHTLVFVAVNSKRFDGKSALPDEPSLDRGECELAAAEFLSKMDDYESDLPIRFDIVSLGIVSVDRAILRHHINALSQD